MVARQGQIDYPDWQYEEGEEDQEGENQNETEENSEYSNAPNSQPQDATTLQQTPTAKQEKIPFEEMTHRITKQIKKCISITKKEGEKTKK